MAKTLKDKVEKVKQELSPENGSSMAEIFNLKTNQQFSKEPETKDGMALWGVRKKK